MPSSVRGLAAALFLFTAPASSFALPLLGYNVVLTGDLNGTVHVEGATFVGGNLISTQMSEFNHKSLTPAGYEGLRVGGNVSGALKIMGGETASYATKSGGATIDCVGLANCASAGANHAAEKAALATEMATLSATYAAQTANGSAQVNGNQVKLRYTGSGPLAIFTVNASDVFFQNATVLLDLGTATRAIINVNGNVNVPNTNLAGTWNNSNTLWNFFNATTVDFNYMAVRGSVLAPTASVFDSAGFDGSLYAKSYTNTSLREIHGFFWTPPTVTRSVPEPTGLLLLGGALLAFARQARRR